MLEFPVPPALPLAAYLAILLGMAIVAGLIGSLAGLGGGVVLVPALILLLRLPFVDAVGTSAISVLATSTAAGAAYVRDGLTDVRTGMALEIATVPGALVGAGLTVVLAHSGLVSILTVLLGVALLVTLPGGLQRRRTEPESGGAERDGIARRWRLEGAYYDRSSQRTIRYRGARAERSLGIMFGAGLVAGMFGIGSGVFKVLALERALGLPMKVATATSNFMIGVTAASASSVLLLAGYVNPVLAAPVALGTILGSFAGTRVLPHLSNRTVKIVFLPLIAALAIELVVRGAFGL
jgi:uncharacterized membrane protein YfcA